MLITLGSALIAAAMAAIGFFAYLKITTPVPPERDASGCPATGPAGITVVLVDGSDALPPIAKEQLVSELTDLADASPKYSLFELRQMEQGSPGGAIRFHACNPGDGTDASVLTGNQQLDKKRWTQNFRTPLEQALQGDFSGSEQDNSPIMQAIQTIAVERFSSAQAEGVDKTLIVVSDMIENEADYNQYHGDLTFARFKKSEAYRKYRTDLHGAEVKIMYIQRQRPQLDSVAHVAFWRDWIADNDGKFDSARTMQGVN